MLQPEDSSVLWLVVVGFIISFILAFGIGANDVANSFGTSVGAKVITLFQACIIAGIFEMAGSILVGTKVSATVRKGILEFHRFNGTETLAMAGSFSALTATSIWLIVATFFNLPVSGTHSSVGAVIGYALVAFHGHGVRWKPVGMIAASWVISPLFSGSISSGIFLISDKFILKSRDPLANGLRALPFLSAFTLFINVFSILYSNADVFGMKNIGWYSILAIAIALSVVTGMLVHFLANPWLEKKILALERKQLHQKNNNDAPLNCGVSSTVDTPEKSDSVIDDVSSVSNASFYTISGLEIDRNRLIRFQSGRKSQSEISRKSIPMIPPSHDKATESKNTFATSSPEKDVNEEENHVTQKENISRKESMRSRAESIRSRTQSLLAAAKPSDEERSKIHDDPSSAELFKYLQIVTACFGAFAHGGNDVSNAIGPVISLWLIYKEGHVHSDHVPVWILIYGGVGIVVGLCVWGRRVIKTIGEDLSPVTPSSGFAIEIGSALTVLIASNLGIPISTTHCKVGSVVMVGRFRSKEVVDWSLFGNIALSWVATMPVTGGIAAAIYAIMRAAGV